MAQSYSDIVQANKTTGNAQLINASYDLQTQKEQFRVDQENKRLKDQAVQDYVDSKVREGYSQNPDGTLTKQIGNTTTTLVLNKDTGSVDVQTRTVNKSTKKGSSQLQKIDHDIKSRQNTIDAYYRGKVDASPSTIQKLKNDLTRLYEARNNLVKTGTAFVIIPGSVTETQSKDNVVFDINGQGYSVAPSLQEEFLSKVNKTESVPLPVAQSFYAPRSVNDSETENVSSPVQINIPVPVQQKTAGVMTATKTGQYSAREFGSDEPLVNQIEAGAIGNLAEIGLGVGAYKIAKGTVEGVASIFKVENTLIEASNFNPNKELQVATKGRIKEGVVSVLKDPFGKLINEPVIAIVENPLEEVPKTAVQVLTLEGVGKSVKGILKSAEVGGTEFRLGTAENVPAVTTATERKALFIDSSQQIKGNVPFELNVIDTRSSQKTLGGSSLVDTAPPSQLSKAPKEPSVIEQQYTLGGRKTFGQTFYDQESGQPKDLTESTQQSMSIVDEIVISDQGGLSIESGVKLKPVNPDDVFKDSTSLKSTDTGQKQGVSRLDTLSEGVGGNQRMFEGMDLKGKSPSLAGSSQSLVGSSVDLSGAQGQLLVLERPLVDVSADSQGSVVRKIGDTILNEDIKGKVTPERYGVGAIALLNTQKSSLKPANVLDLKSKTDTSTKQNQDQKNVQRTVTEPQVKVLQFQSQESTQSQVSLQKSEQKVDYAQVQALKSQLTTKLDLIEEPIKPLLPKASVDRQVKSGKGLFKVLVKKQGKFVTIGQGYSDLATAINRGKQEIKDTARASFKVVSTFGEPQKININNDRTLRPSKVDANVVVQKSSFRISSPGEKKEIQQRGVFLQRTRRGLRRAKKQGVFN